MRYLKSRRGNSCFLFLHLQLFSDYYVFVLSDSYFSMRTSRRFYFKVLFTYLFCVWVYCLHVCLFSMFVKCPPGPGEELDLRYSNLLTTKSFLQSSRNFWFCIMPLIFTHWEQNLRNILLNSTCQQGSISHWATISVEEDDYPLTIISPQMSRKWPKCKNSTLPRLIGTKLGHNHKPQMVPDRLVVCYPGKSLTMSHNVLL